MNKIKKILNTRIILTKIIFVFSFIIISTSFIQKVDAATTIYECKAVVMDSSFFTQDETVNLRLAHTQGLEPDRAYYYYYLSRALEINK